MAAGPSWPDLLGHQALCGSWPRGRVDLAPWGLLPSMDHRRGAKAKLAWPLGASGPLGLGPVGPVINPPMAIYSEYFTEPNKVAIVGKSSLAAVTRRAPLCHNMGTWTMEEHPDADIVQQSVIMTAPEPTASASTPSPFSRKVSSPTPEYFSGEVGSCGAQHLQQPATPFPSLHHPGTQPATISLPSDSSSSRSPKPDPFCLDLDLPSPPQLALLQHHMPFTPDLIRRKLTRLHTGKAAGPDGVFPRVLKACAAQLCGVLSLVFSLSLHLKRVPVLWKTSCFVPVPKTPRPNGSQDYRPVAYKADTSPLVAPLASPLICQLRTARKGRRFGLTLPSHTPTVSPLRYSKGEPKKKRLKASRISLCPAAPSAAKRISTNSFQVDSSKVCVLI
ncbi:unnamed protein product [Menidia menidia]|uniref:(Atlantic silverside) hypothetical protein n=1 Tax=Menidia menidia TaxID=238744 RepID=A0A8S4BIM6_9TELE|nr:unnamed protein product [Menidia menidia]